MADSNIFVGQTLQLGFVMKDQNNTVVDISTTTNTVVIKRIGGDKAIKSATLATDGIDGSMYYILSGTELDIAGVWAAQAIITFPGGAEYPGNIKTFNVLQRLG